MAEDKELHAKIDKVAEDVAEIKTALKGYDGQPGLCARHDKLETSFYKFRNRVIIIGAFILGTGLLGFGIDKLIGLLK